jgi:hypothetical protein
MKMDKLVVHEVATKRAKEEEKGVSLIIPEYLNKEGIT